MLSNKAKYGIKAALYLSRQYGRGPVLISEIADDEAIPKKFLELILLEMKKHGILHSKMGKGGGYMLAKAPDKISVGQIVRVLEGPIALTSCVSKTAYKKCDECTDERTCRIRRIFKQVRDTTAEILDGTTLTDALKSKINLPY